MTIMTTDRVGSMGYNAISFDSDLADYVFNINGFSGTSAVAPIVSGITALMLSANPNLTVEFHRRGGHVGFVTGAPWRPAYYVESRVTGFLAGLLSADQVDRSGVVAV